MVMTNDILYRIKGTPFILSIILVDILNVYAMKQIIILSFSSLNNIPIDFIVETYHKKLREASVEDQ